MVSMRGSRKPEEDYAIQAGNIAELKGKAGRICQRLRN